MLGNANIRSLQPSLRVSPNLFIVGAPKAGTTSLYEYLKQHPDIFMSSNKEPSYFVKPRGRWRSAFSLEAYLDLFKDASAKKAVGEASTAYLGSKESPKWIKSFCGNPKIVILLRNPAKRAFSHYIFNIMKGWESAKTFEEALDQEAKLIRIEASFENSGKFPPDFLYFKGGLYSHQVKNYFDIFGTEDVKIYLFEDLVRDPLSVCRDIFKFLDVDDNFVPFIEVYNESRAPRSIALQTELYRKAEEEKLRPGRLACGLCRTYRKLMELNNTFGAKPHLSESLYKDLISLYRADIVQLERLLHRELSVWYGNAK